MQSGHTTHTDLKRRSHSVSASLVTGIVAALANSDIEPLSALAQANISASLLDDPAGRIPLDDFLCFLTHLRKAPHADDSLGIRLGCQLAISSFNALGYAAANSQSLAQALALIPEYESIVLTCGKTRVELGEKEVTVSWAMSLGETPPALINLLEDVFLASWVTLAKMLTGQNVLLERADFPHRQPDNIALWQTIFGPTMRFNQAQALVSFSQPLLHLPINHSDPFVHQVMLREAKALSATLQHNTLTDKVSEWLVIALPDGEPEQKSVAAFLHMSERTLRRHLQQEGTSYQKVLEATRQRRANYYLQQTDLPLAQIADQLGYQHLSAFNAAYKRWTGNTPARYRELSRKLSN